jgi:hypothetical protein
MAPAPSPPEDTTKAGTTNPPSPLPGTPPGTPPETCLGSSDLVRTTPWPS